MAKGTDLQSSIGNRETSLLQVTDKLDIPWVFKFSFSCGLDSSLRVTRDGKLENDD